MRTLRDYTEEAHTALFKECGAFFAFSNEQLQEGLSKLDGEEVSNLGGGMFCLSKNVDTFIVKMEEISKNAREQYIKDCGINAVIMNELSNHEAQIFGDISDTVEALEGYDCITPEMVAKVFKDEYMPMCIEKDLF